MLTNTAYLNSIKHKVRKDFIRIEISEANEKWLFKSHRWKEKRELIYLYFCSGNEKNAHSKYYSESYAVIKNIFLQWQHQNLVRFLLVVKPIHLGSLQSLILNINFFPTASDNQKGPAGPS